MVAETTAVGRWARRGKEGSESRPDHRESPAPHLQSTLGSGERGAAAECCDSHGCRGQREGSVGHRRRWLIALVAAVAAGTLVAVASRPAGHVAIGRLGRFAAACARSFRSPPVPRELSWIVVKRMRPRFGDSYGHWWVELDGVESYGWWPRHGPMWLRTLLVGGQGSLNGSSKGRLGRIPKIDPRHGDRADHEFHPTLVVRKSDWRVRRDLRGYSRNFEGGWRWTVKRASTNCRSFQLGLLEAAGLVESDDWLHTRGRGCPLLHLLRTTRCSLRQLRHGHVAPHRRGGPCGCPALWVPPLPPMPGLKR